MSKKICIIGAGSAIFSLNLIKDICVNDHFKGCTVSLMDTNPDRLDAIYGLCTRYTEELGGNIQVLKTLERREAMQGADFVVNVALDHGHDRYKQGIDVAYANGYRFGGSLHVLHDEAFFINFHQLKLMESILVDLLDICPEAYYVMVANPVQAGVTYLKRKYPQAKVIGMCHGYNGVMDVARGIGLDPRDVSYEIAGVNHFIWMTDFRYKGEDAYPLLDKWLAEHESEFFLEEKKSRIFGPKSVDLYRTYGVFPIGDTANPGGGAWGWKYHTDAAVEKACHEDPYGWYQDYFQLCEDNVQLIRNAVENKEVKVSDVFSSIPSDEPMIPLIESLAFGVENKVIVNILNEGGYMKGLPTDYEVEIAAMVDRHGIHPIHNEGLPKPVMAQMFRDRIAPVEMELAAFTEGRLDYLVELVMMDPWTKDEAQARKLIDGIFALPCNADMKEHYR